MHTKEAIRKLLGPLLPIVRFFRALPARLTAIQKAAAFQKSDHKEIFYLTRRFPARPATRTEYSNGGEVKMTFLAESYPHHYPQVDILYAVSSVDHVAKNDIIRQARKKGIKIILNQNGVAYLAWHGAGWEATNTGLRKTYELADFIIYQSEFCKLAAETFLGKASVPHTILYNPVDTNFYKPKTAETQNNAPVLLLGGNQFSRYRFEIAAQTLKEVSRIYPEAFLIVTGNLWGDSQVESKEWAVSYLKKLGLTNRVEFTGRYPQTQATQIFHRANILIHPQYMDPSPNLVCEALACGIPVVYSDSGGTPELVGDKAGVGVKVPVSWEKIGLPDPTLMAKGVFHIWEDYQKISQAARERALESFGLEKFIHAHWEIFSKLKQ